MRQMHRDYGTNPTDSDICRKMKYTILFDSDRSRTNMINATFCKNAILPGLKFDANS